MKQLPPLNLNHLFRLTDETGILQHARFSIPDRNHGYCLDDNARALLVIDLLDKLYGEKFQMPQLSEVYLSFVDHAYNPATHKFRNFMDYSRQWLETSGSEDSQGRAIWAIGTLFANRNFKSVHSFTEKLVEHAYTISEELHHPRAISYSLLGLAEIFMHKPEHAERAKVKSQKLLEKLWDRFRVEKPRGWLWFEERVTYGNSRVAQAFISAGFIFPESGAWERGIALLDWLIKKQFESGMFVPIGNEKWMTPGYKSRFDQQPLEACGMIDACLSAWKLTREEKYYRYALSAFDWFLGGNLAGKPVYDAFTGGCRDGIHETGINRNQGAESTLAWLHSRLAIELHHRHKEKIEVVYES